MARYYCKAEIGFWVRVEDSWDADKNAREALDRMKALVNEDYWERMALPGEGREDREKGWQDYPVDETHVRSVANLKDYEIVVRARLRTGQLDTNDANALRSVVAHILDEGTPVHCDTAKIETAYRPVTLEDKAEYDAHYRKIETARERLRAAEGELRAMDVAASPAGAQQVRDEISRLKGVIHDLTQPRPPLSTEGKA